MIYISKVSNKLTRFVMDQYDLSGALNAMNQSVDQPEIDTTAFSDTGPRSIIDYYRTRDEINGFYMHSVGEIDEIINGLIGDENDHYLLKLWGNNAENAVAYEMIGRLVSNPISGRTGGVQMLNASFAGSNACSRGLVLRSALITEDGNGTGRNMGATLSGQEFQVVFRILGGTFAELTLSVQESSDNGAGDAYALITGLTATFSDADTPAVSRKTTTAATEAYKRVTVSDFDGTDALVLVTAGLVTAFAS